jgi:plasmid stabilization system protein ParE
LKYSADARRQIRDLIRHYENLGRAEAARTLANSLVAAERRIAANPADGLSAPRPYPTLVRPGVAWIKAGRYWIAYRCTERPTILAVFYETADIPGRL